MPALLAQQSDTVIPVGKIFIIRSFPVEFNANNSYRTYVLRGSANTLMDTSGIYKTSAAKRNSVTDKYTWQNQNDRLSFILIDDQATARLRALLVAPLLPGDPEKQIMDL